MFDIRVMSHCRGTKSE